MKRSPLVATLIVAFLVVGLPVIVIRRLTEGLLPTQAYDILLGVGVIAWILVCKAMLDRTNPVQKLIENRLSPSWQAHHLVEQSMFGVGFVSKKAARMALPDAQLHRLHDPHVPIDLFLPPQEQEPKIGRTRGELEEANRPRLQPTLLRPETAAPPITATEEYIVVRGDTFWSIAEARLGDGRRWKSVEAINAGREVAPGVHFEEGETVRIGWSVLVPVAEESVVA